MNGTRFTKNGKPFFVSGINYWAGTTLARTGNAAGWDQVRRDLDGIQAAGINMIRTMGATEGPDTEPQRIVPTIQPAPGQYDPAGVEGVLRFAEELQTRGLYGIYMLSNFWQWSGGFAQYVAWAGRRADPVPAADAERQLGSLPEVQRAPSTRTPGRWSSTTTTSSSWSRS